MYLEEVNRLYWRKSLHSMGNGACIEVASREGHVAVRDSKDPDGAMLLYSAAEWRSFLARANGSAFSTPRS
jgi:hypothetical protein